MCQVIHFILQGGERGEKTLIHCERGISRSASLAAAFRMWSSGERWQTACDYVQARRKIVSPNIAFTCNLIELGEIFHGTSSTASLLFRCAYHSPHDPHTAVLKVCRTSSRRLVVPALSCLSPNGAFVLRGVREEVHYLFLWRGQQVSESTALKAEILALQMRKIFTTATVLYKVSQGQEDELFRSFLVMDHEHSSADPTYVDYFDLAGEVTEGADMLLDEPSSYPTPAMLPFLLKGPAQEALYPTLGASNSVMSGLTDMDSVSYQANEDNRDRGDRSICLPTLGLQRDESSKSIAIDETALKRTISGADILSRVNGIISLSAKGKGGAPPALSTHTVTMGQTGSIATTVMTPRSGAQGIAAGERRVFPSLAVPTVPASPTQVPQSRGRLPLSLPAIDPQATLTPKKSPTHDDPPQSSRIWYPTDLSQGLQVPTNALKVPGLIPVMPAEGPPSSRPTSGRAPVRVTSAKALLPPFTK